jgi:acyl-CoA synthetase (AMP-forming)/AMP-acid ligase II/NAD(P)-dependent dehydrogenase (short-subunit alcohol dehydrogenase family)/acyl carrier protein
VTLDELPQHFGDSCQHDADPNAIALLLLTSGSTGAPKGVVLSHRNILSMAAGLADMHELSTQDVSLNWMPMDHVGGLVLSHLRDVHLGCEQVHVDKQYILESPLRWLDALDRHRCTLTWAPNFAFALVNDRVKEIESRRWNLSSLRCIFNAGEAIVPQTARRFLELLAPCGLPSIAMRPMWGMSETSSGVVCSRRFHLDAEHITSPFVEVGAPIAGVALRIADSKGAVLSEGEIGRLQVSGATLTAGYFRRSDLNDELFHDGWFETGDLGFLRDGRLTITGRSKDVIIVNGANYYCHEVESVVEEVSGVEPSFTAACAIRRRHANTDAIAVFFHSPCTLDEGLSDVMKRIRARVAERLGVQARYVIPVERDEIPKTSIGKIQRTQLKDRFEAGEFDAIVKTWDLRLGTARTLPAWFHRGVWRPKEPTRLMPSIRNVARLVFADRAGLGSALVDDLRRAGMRTVVVHEGTSFTKHDSDRFEIDPRDESSYRRLLSSIDGDGIQIEEILHLWSYGAALRARDTLDAELGRGAASVLLLIQALDDVARPNRPLRLLVVSSHADPVTGDADLVHVRGALRGCLQTAAQEISWLRCRHLHLPIGDVGSQVSLLLDEIRAVDGDVEIAYRSGRRVAWHLERLDFDGDKPSALPFARQGLYLLSGGLGGIGTEIARYLLTHFDARLLLIGRTSLSDGAIGHRAISDASVVERRREAYRSLQRLSSEIRYEALDVCDPIALRRAVDEARARWRRPLSGIVHLAGSFEERLLADETVDGLASTIRTKLEGARALHELIADDPAPLFVSFSSVNGLLGGFRVGAYAAASSALDCFSAWQRARSPVQAYGLNWTMWRDVGMARDYAGAGLSRARGYHALTIDQGLTSLLACLHHGSRDATIGLETSNFHLRRFADTESPRRHRLTAYYTSRTADAVDRERAAPIRDPFGVASACDVVRLDELPTTDTGDIDRERLAAKTSPAGGPSSARRGPRSPLESQVVEIWKDVLGVGDVGIDDDFFGLGGDSITATQVVARLTDALQVDVPLRRIFDAPTVAGLAAAIDEAALSDGALA